MNFQFDPKEMKKILSYIKRAFLFDIRAKLLGAVPSLEKNLRPEIQKRIENSDVIQALRHDNEFRGDLGLKPEEIEFMANKIPEVIARSVQVRVKPHTDSIDFIVEVVRDSVKELLDLPEASFIQTYTSGKQTEIKWLEWLLTKGDAIIVSDFHVIYKPGYVGSRSLEAIMVPKGSFRIRPEYAGDDQNNFITRALEGIEVYILEEVKKFL